ncbi:MAG: DUF1508 domain-containing protein [Clostridia bacterium]|nr:DUF1508 domain-containing protein [Clostridia bacterium]
MEFIKKAFNAILDYAKAKPLLAGITAAAGVFALIVLTIIIVLSVKASKRKKAMQNAVTAAVSAPAEEQPATPVEEPVILPAPDPEPEVEIAPVAEETKEEPVPEPVAEEAKEEPAPAPVVEEAAVAKTAQEETKTEEASVEEKATEEKPAEKKPAVKKTATKAKATEKPAEKPVEKPAEKQKRYNGKWIVCKLVTEGAEENEEMYFFELRASNGEKLLSSEEYTSYNGALKGIETHKANIAKGNFRITLSKKGDYIFKLLNGKNMLLCTGANYKTRVRCEKAIESTKRFAETAIVDETVQELLVKIPAEEETAAAPLTEGYNGKWIIASNTSAEGETVYYFELFANNGEKLLSSEEYTTYVGAVNGIETHRKNIENGNFRITLTKRGDYIYKLLNGNGQLLCLGEHYKTRRLCQNAVESVKRFAIASPVITNENK